MVVEAEQLVLVLQVVGELLLKEAWASGGLDLRRAAGEAVAVLWHEGVDEHSVLFVADVFLVVVGSAVLAGVLALFDIDEHLFGKGGVHERVKASTVLLK